MMSECIEIIIDSEVVSEYTKHYFALHPRAKNPPIASPTHPSINQWMILQRQAMNTLKQKWKDFSVWVIQKNGLSNMRIEHCRIEFSTFYGRNTRHDVDNYVPKFIMDGFVEAGFLVDDDDKHVGAITLMCSYDKNDPRTVIRIYVE